jgi:hypothetical protein
MLAMLNTKKLSLQCSKYLSKNFEGKYECGNRARSKCFFSPEPCVPTLRHYDAKLLLRYLLGQSHPSRPVMRV